MNAEETFALRRSMQPYVTLGAIFAGVVIWALVLAYRKLDRGTAESAVLLLAFYAAYVFLGMRYRISLSDNRITQRAFGKRNVSISIRNISSVGTEVSDTKTFVQMNRPMRRIVRFSRRRARNNDRRFDKALSDGRYPEIDANHPFGESGFERAKQVALVTYDKARGSILDFLCVSFLNTCAATCPTSVSGANCVLSLP
jgi:hypothetical protein